MPGEEETRSEIDSIVDETIIDETRKSNESSLNITLGLNRRGFSAPDDANLHVAVSSETPSWQKKHFCLYCQKFQSKLARHLETVHSGEADVKKFSVLPPKNLERQAIIASIRKRGNHVYNNDRRFNTGDLLVCRRPNIRMKKTARDFLACGNCKAQISRTLLHVHFKKCTKKSRNGEKIAVSSGRKITARLHERASDAVRSHIYPYLRDDDIVRGIRYDELVTLFANKQCERYSTHEHQYQMVRGRVRLLGRFMAAVKKIKSSINEFAQVFTSRHYDVAIEAVKQVAQFDEKSHTFKHPATAFALGTLLKQCGDILRSEYIKRENEHDQKRVEDFLKLQVEDYGTSINRVVAETQAQHNRRKKVVLPTNEDIRTFHNYLQDARRKYFNKLQKKFTFSDWKNLGETTLLTLQLFNRRRPGETERIYLEDFNNYQGIDSFADKETFNMLTEDGKKNARSYVRFEIRGKLGRGVPVLVHKELFDCLALIIRHRDVAGVPRSNPYLFGLPSTDKNRNKYLRACRLMNEYSQLCGAAIPSTLRGIQLRKHIATRCINLNMTDGEVNNLANFMGHDAKIHKDIYRQPVLQTDIVHMTKILKMAQGCDDVSGESEDSDEENVSMREESSFNSGPFSFSESF